MDGIGKDVDSFGANSVKLASRRGSLSIAGLRLYGSVTTVIAFQL